MWSRISSGRRAVKTWARGLHLELPGRGRPWLRAALAVVFLPPVAVYLWLLLLPSPLDLRWREPGRTSFMEYRIREARRNGEALELRRRWVPLSEISRHLQRAVLVAEDDRFYLHSGIDWRALGEEVRYGGDSIFSPWDPEDLQALWSSLRYAWDHRGEIKGRSTITQQLAKNLYFSPERSVLRKLSEAVVARRLEAYLPKERILELYLNVAEWGPGLFGAQAAAEAYFGRDARDLSLYQGASLAATLPHPLTSNPGSRPARMEWRRQLILARLQGLPAPPPEVEIAPPRVDTTGGESGPGWEGDRRIP